MGEWKAPFQLHADWPTISLGDVCSRGGGDVQTGPFGSQLHKSDYVDDGIPSVMPVNIGDNQISTDGIARITVEDSERLSRYRLKSGDIVYSRRGDVERRSLVRKREEGWLCGTGCLRVRVGQGVTDPVYASYYLGHPSVRAWISRHAIGATMPNLNTSIMQSLPFVLPPLHEQKAIAHILGTLDDKIELNRRMNETLEAIASAIFKSWFVDFDPVHAKAEGRDTGLPKEIEDLLPDRFEPACRDLSAVAAQAGGHGAGRDSELGEIPKGWTVGVLGDIAANPRRGVKPNEVSPVTPYIGLEHMPRRSIALDSWGMAEQVGSQKSRFDAGDILFGKLRPYFHKVGIAPVSGVCSTDILVITPKDDAWRSYVLEVVSSKAFVDYTDAHSAGTKMPRTNWKDMSRYPLVLPPGKLAEEFHVYVAPLLHKLGMSVRENRHVRGLRDAMLPQLLSGKVALPELLQNAGRAS